MSNEHLTIAQFAAAADVGVETVRFYHRRKLLPLPRTPDGAKVRRYGQSDLERLRFIRRAQQLGFSLDEVRALLALDSEQDCDVARSLAEQKLADVELRLPDDRHLGPQRESLGRQASATVAFMNAPAEQHGMMTMMRQVDPAQMTHILDDCSKMMGAAAPFDVPGAPQQPSR